VGVSLRRLPVWLADGPIVSDVAYRVVEVALDAPRTLDTTGVSLVDVVDHVAALLEVDEADVLRAFAELERAGVLATK
jgi:hypothetical protein